MPNLRGEEIMRAGIIGVPSPLLQAQMDRDKASPHCVKCGNPMSELLRRLYGHDTHICCDPHDPIGPAELAACRRAS